MIIHYIFWGWLLIYILAMMDWILQECNLYVYFIEKIKNLFKKKRRKIDTTEKSLMVSLLDDNDYSFQTLYSQHYKDQIINEKTIKRHKMTKFPLLKNK